MFGIRAPTVLTCINNLTPVAIDANIFSAMNLKVTSDTKSARLLFEQGRDTHKDTEPLYHYFMYSLVYEFCKM